MARLQWICLARIAQILSSLPNHILRPTSPYFFFFYLSFQLGFPFFPLALNQCLLPLATCIEEK